MSNLFQIINHNALVVLFFLNLAATLTLLVTMWKQSARYSKLFYGVKGENLQLLIENYFKTINLVKKDQEKQENMIEEINEKSKNNFDKMGFYRFNPFQETGGDQSFVLALLNRQDDGVVMTSLHGRNQTRVFAKRVINGKADNNTFSGEEEEVIKQIRRQNLKKQTGSEMP
jgi:hypothetical protein